jgi:hypothetical protein
MGDGNDPRSSDGDAEGSLSVEGSSARAPPHAHAAGFLAALPWELSDRA